MTFEVTEEGNGCAGIMNFGSDRGRAHHNVPPPDQLELPDVGDDGEGGAEGPGGEELPPPSETPLAGDTEEEEEEEATATADAAAHPKRNLLPQEPPTTFCSSTLSHTNSGLKNLGNTCYANSILQALFSLSKIRRHIYNLEDSDGGGPFHRILNRLFGEMRKRNRNNGIFQVPFGAVKPVEFCSEFRKAKPQFRRNEQQDAQEFLSLLLDLLHDECNKAKKQKNKKEVGPLLLTPPPTPPSSPPPARPPAPSSAEEAWEHQVTNVDNSFFSKMLMGQTESCLTCQTCGNSSLSWSSFWQLPLAVQKEKKKTGEEDATLGEVELKKTVLTLCDCISEFMETEILSDDCAPLCEKCQRREPASKKLTIVRSPRFLILHLKRFDESGTKITRPVIIPNHLPGLAGQKYRLRCCVLHRGGEVYQGHYTTLIAEKDAVADTFSPQARASSKWESVWMLADDDTITRGISEERALNWMKRYAYIAVYQAVYLPEGRGGEGCCKAPNDQDKDNNCSVALNKDKEKDQAKENVST